MGLSIDHQISDLLNVDPTTFRLNRQEKEFIDQAETDRKAGKKYTTDQLTGISNLWDTVFIHGRRRIFI
jgi:hypothetical protein